MNLSETEKMFGVKFPEKMRKLYSEGKMEWIEAGIDKFNEERDRYLNDPNSFLMLNCDCEPLFLEEIPKRTEELKEWISWKEEDEDVKLKENIKLVPFAHTGGGDLYCFLYENDTDEPKVIWYFHDDYEDPDIVGDSFDEFLYFEMLDAAGNNEEDIEGPHWKAHLEMLEEDYRKKLDGKSQEEIEEMFSEVIFQKAEIFE